MSFLRRLFGGSAPAPVELPADAQDHEPDAVEATAAPELPASEPDAPPAEDPGIACPSCAALIRPTPPRNRRCPRCRNQVIIRRFEGRTVYLSEASLLVFEAERRREQQEAAWTRERTSWLRHARQAGAPQERLGRLEARPISCDVVDESRRLYLATATKAIAAERRRGELEIAARIGRELAQRLHHAAGAPAVPPDEALDAHRTAMGDLLKALRATGTHAEIVGTGCCAACRVDDGKVFAIAKELRADRLPHAGCPRGLCACEWWLGINAPKRQKARRRRAAGAAGGSGAGAPVLVPGVEPNLVEASAAGVEPAAPQE